jgi:hypothetical protein
MKTLKIKLVQRASAFIVCLFLSLTGFSQAHVTMSVKNITSTKNTIQYDLYIINDGQTNLKLSACSYGVNFNPSILNDGKLTYTFMKSDKDESLKGLSAFSLATTQVGEVAQARMTTTPIHFDHAIDLPLNKSIKIGRFMIINSQEWSPNSNPLFALQESKILGLTTTVIVGYIDESHELVALTPSLKTVTTLVEKSSLLNPSQGNKRIVQSSNEESWMIYPNPAIDELNIDFNAIQRSDIVIHIHDMQGRLVKQIHTSAIEGLNHLQIDLSELAKGMYTMKLSDSKELNFTKTFTKQ